MSVLRVGGIELGYEVAGAGPAVVLLHGFPFNRSMWREQVEVLSQSRRVITPDLRGHGETSAMDEAATMERMAEDTTALLDELGIERAVVGGLSMGGYVALAFYRLFPERVRAMVLADTRATPDTEEARRTREETAQRALKEGMGAIVETMLPKLVAPATLEGNAEVLSRLREMMERTNPVGAASALRGMALRRDQTDLLARIDVPVLVVVGDSDAVTPPKDAEAMHAAIAGSHLQVIEGAGHVSNMERPEEFNRALLEFLDALEA
ncbi:MAG TPA: alpha/beta fold hydrolase [Pyrinomonadaceae bacterium]|jgi:3-oxoadipate enol-lactonase